MPLQPAKSIDPIETTLFPKVRDLRPMQSEKAEWSMVSTLLGIVTEAKPLHS